jgi:hypothetical protein
VLTVPCCALYPALHCSWYEVSASSNSSNVNENAHALSDLAFVRGAIATTPHMTNCDSNGETTTKKQFCSEAINGGIGQAVARLQHRPPGDLEESDSNQRRDDNACTLDILWGRSGASTFWRPHRPAPLASRAAVKLVWVHRPVAARTPAHAGTLADIRCPNFVFIDLGTACLSPPGRIFDGRSRSTP